MATVPLYRSLTYRNNTMYTCSQCSVRSTISFQLFLARTTSHSLRSLHVHSILHCICKNKSCDRKVKIYISMILLMLLSSFWIPTTSYSQGTIMNGITLEEISVPSPVVAGKDLEINCRFKLGALPLYFLKWFKDDVEFYRYSMENKTPKIRTFNVVSVNVDLRNSFEGKVLLRNISELSGGIYKCEVSEEKPSFKTLRLRSQLTVYVAPSESPFISGVKKSYGIGDILNITCISGPAYPSIRIKWLINDAEVRGKDNVESKLINSPGREHITSSRLTIRLNKLHFKRGSSMKISCNALMPTYYNDSTEIVVKNKNAIVKDRNSVPFTSGNKRKDVERGRSRNSDLNSTSGSALIGTLGFISLLSNTFIHYVI